MTLPDLREALRRLCSGYEWSYGVFWRHCPSDPRMLLMEECYYEEQVRNVVDQMQGQVHFAGEGTVGVAALSGKHQWIYYDDTGCTDPSLTEAGDMTRAGDCLDNFQGDADLAHQFCSGIKTIAIISLQPLGVVQFGSSQKISESLKFVNQVHYMVRQLETMASLSQTVDAQNRLFTTDLHSVFASVISSGATYSSHNKIRNTHEIMCNVQVANAESSIDHIMPSSFCSRGSHDDLEYHVDNMNPHVLPMRAVSYSTDLWSKENTMSSGMTLQGFPTLLPTKSQFSFPRANMFRQFGGGFGESCSLYGSEGDLSAKKPLSKEASFVSEHPENYSSFPLDLTFEHSQPIHCKDDPVTDLVHLGNQLLDHMGDTMTVPRNENLPNNSCVSTVLLEGDSIRCSQIAQLPINQVVNSSLCAMNSFDIGSEWKAKPSNVPTLPQSDSDMFNGLDLDLNPRISRQGHWDDLVLPLVDGGCSSLTTSVPECTKMGSSGAADKGFFSECTLDELLDAVISGNVNSSSSHSSNPSPANSVGGDGSELQRSKTTKPSGSQVNGIQAPLGRPSLIRTTSTECNLEKIIQNSFREISKSHTSPRIDDTCSMNAESSVVSQHNKTEENAKVAKKRARPGESTRPRPKDRQQIQDRVKELRELVPNGAKCSIDSLLDRTIKHMLFLQSVTKHADKLRQADEPKMIGNKSGVVLKDHLSSGGGGATWAYEVAGHTMVCPLIVEDLNPLGQMLVEILCEDRGFFHEIADIIRGFGLTILKGVMEVHDSKIWARFLVEANREVTRMDIFLSLIQLLQ